MFLPSHGAQAVRQQSPHAGGGAEGGRRRAQDARKTGQGKRS